MKVTIITLGCKVNQSESMIIEGNLIKQGCSIVGISEYPDYCIINTCTVTQKSDYQSRQLIRKAIRTGAKIIVTGCYAQLKPEDIQDIKGVTRIVYNNNKYSIINILTGIRSSYTYNYTNKSRPYIKVQDGCNFSCTYCVVPLARGKSKSIRISEVINQAIEFESSGYKEIVLTGIHLGSYGKDLKNNTNLSKLIKELLNKTRILRIRLSSLEIKEINDEIRELIQDKRICRHLHLPLQSGDDRILNNMKRMYNSKEYEKTVNNIYKKLSNIAIGTDVIVGFPGESKKEFLNTKNLINRLPFSYLHLFPFSSRPNTIASKMKEQISPYVKRERLSELNAINIKKKSTYISAQKGKTVDIIIEERLDNDVSVGTSSNYLKVEIPSKTYDKGSLVYVRIRDVEENKVKGEPIDKL